MGAYVKFKLGMTHSVHNCMETSHVTYKITLAGEGFEPTAYSNMYISYGYEICMFNICLSVIMDAIPASIPIVSRG